MREPAEAADDVGVNFRPFQVFGVSDRLVERDAALLVGEVFRVLERKIEEATQFRSAPGYRSRGRWRRL